MCELHTSARPLRESLLRNHKSVAATTLSSTSDQFFSNWRSGSNQTPSILHGPSFQVKGPTDFSRLILVVAITILYRNTKVRSPDGDTEYFDIVAGVLQGDTLAPYLFIICLDYVVRTSIDKIKENGFELTKKRSRRDPAKTITDADSADDIAILANTPNQAETLLHSLEQAAFFWF